MLTNDQKRKVLEAVENGATWIRAAEMAGVNLGEMLKVVTDGRMNRCEASGRFLRHLQAAGKVATARSLAQHNRVAEHA